METLHLTLIVATLLCSLVAGILLAFAIVVMPGLRTFDDRRYLETFKAIDRVIQNNHPVFMVVWLGSITTLVTSVVLGWKPLTGLDFVLLLVAGILYVGGVQLPTAWVNVPANNRLQATRLANLSGGQLTRFRGEFESPWVRWNIVRTAAASLTSFILLLLLTRL